MGYSLWGHRESDTTGRLSTAWEQSQSCHLKEGKRLIFMEKKKKNFPRKVVRDLIFKLERLIYHLNKYIHMFK